MTGSTVREEPTNILAVVREELQFAWRIVLCALYISLWRLKHYIWTDTKLNKRSSILAAFASFILFVEILLSVFHKEVGVWLGGSAIAVLVPTASVLVLHRVGELGKKRKENSFARRVAPLVDAFYDLSKSMAAPVLEKQGKLDSFVLMLLGQLCEDIAAGKRTPVSASIMMREPGNGPLRIVYLFPVGTKYDPAIRFELGVGAAGFCYDKARTVYIPSITYMHGIVIGELAGEVEYGLKRRLYAPIAEEYEIYQSILCLPVTSREGATHGVLNVDSKSVDFFSIQDVDVLRAYARILGDAISLYI
jgi:hypothetical protein